jgi:hypothetical protein
MILNSSIKCREHHAKHVLSLIHLINQCSARSLCLAVGPAMICIFSDTIIRGFSLFNYVTIHKDLCSSSFLLSLIIRQDFFPPVCHISLIYFRNDTFYDGVYIFLSFVDVSKYAISIYQQIILLLDLFQNGQ